MRDQRLPEEFIKAALCRHFREVKKSAQAFVNGFGSAHIQLGTFGSKLQKEVNEFALAAKTAHIHSRYICAGKTWQWGRQDQPVCADWRLPPPWRFCSADYIALTIFLLRAAPETTFRYGHDIF